MNPALSPQQMNDDAQINDLLHEFLHLDQFEGQGPQTVVPSVFQKTQQPWFSQHCQTSFKDSMTINNSQAVSSGCLTCYSYLSLKWSHNVPNSFRQAGFFNSVQQVGIYCVYHCPTSLQTSNQATNSTQQSARTHGNVYTSALQKIYVLTFLQQNSRQSHCQQQYQGSNIVNYHNQVGFFFRCPGTYNASSINISTLS